MEGGAKKHIVHSENAGVPGFSGSERGLLERCLFRKDHFLELRTARPATAIQNPETRNSN